MIGLHGREELIAALEGVIREEIVLMRHMLTSLQDEHNAIESNDLGRIEAVMAERLILIESFERTLLEIISLASQLDGVIVPDKGQEEVIDHLRKMLRDDDLELLSLLKQRDDILQEIYMRNERNSLLLMQHIHLLDDEHVVDLSYQHPLTVTYGTHQKRLAKQAIQLLDRES